MAGYSNHIGKNQSGKVAGADPEVDERLKNIEPKMIELITNEVRSQEELWSVIHILESPDRTYRKLCFLHVFVVSHSFI